jgi:hypothetical protein
MALAGVGGAGVALGAVFGTGAGLDGVFEAALGGAFRSGAVLSAAFIGAAEALILSTGWEPAAAERAFLPGLAAEGGVEAAVLAAPDFALSGESGFLDFINDDLSKTCHQTRPTIAEALAARNQKFS